MKLSKKKTLKILAYCTTAAIFLGGTNIASAELDSEESSGNTINIENKSVTNNIVGGETVDGDASNNTVNISGNNTKINNGYTYGGHATGSGNANNNKINIEGNGTINSHIHVGDAVSGRVFGNVLNIRGGNFTGGWISGAYLRGNGTSSGNVVNIYGGDFNIDYIEGSWGEGTHTNNVVNIYGGKIHGGIISGAWVQSDTTATGNEVNISKGTIDGNATVAGAYMTKDGSVRGNSANVSGGEITGDVHGGYVTGSGNAIGNMVNISGGKITGEILGGYVGVSGSVTDNSINIYGSPDLSGATIYAGRIDENTDLYSSRNSLNIYTKGLTAKNVGGFDTLNFYMPSGIKDGDTILRLTDGETQLSQTKVNFFSDGSSNLVENIKINLLANDNGIKAPSGLEAKNYITQGVSLDYGLTFDSEKNDAGDIIAYTATMGKPSDKLTPATDILNSGSVDSAGLLDSGTDRVADWLPPEGLTGESIPTTQFNPFAGIGGSVFKIKTSDGQKLKSKNAGIDVGMARYIRNSGGVLVFGPITDYGRDNYESHLRHTKEEGSSEMYTTDGHGSSQYFAAGIIARQMNTDSLGNPDGMYYEGSLRAGRIHTNFASDNFMVHGVPMHAEYSASMPCFAGHARVGWTGNVGGTSRLDAYGIYSLNRVNGFTTKLSTGENYRFSPVNSGRIRIGARLTRDYKDIHTFYSGLAYIQEFSGATHGEYMNRPTGRSSLKGTSGMLELGWRVKQSATTDTMFDVYANGWVGHQKGVTFTAKFRRDF